MRKQTSQSGNVLFVILVMVAIVGALGATLMQNGGDQAVAVNNYRLVDEVKSQFQVIRAALQECALTTSSGFPKTEIATTLPDSFNMDLGNNSFISSSTETRNYFQILDKGSGNTYYARVGDISQDSNGLLVYKGDPQYLLQPAITIPPAATQVIIYKDGIVSAVISGDPNPIQLGQLQIASFNNANALLSIGNGLYEKNVSSGDACISNPGGPECVTGVPVGYLQEGDGTPAPVQYGATNLSNVSCDSSSLFDNTKGRTMPSAPTQFLPWQYYSDADGTIYLQLTPSGLINLTADQVSGIQNAFPDTTVTVENDGKIKIYLAQAANGGGGGAGGGGNNTPCTQDDLYIVSAEFGNVSPETYLMVLRDTIVNAQTSFPDGNKWGLPELIGNIDYTTAETMAAAFVNGESPAVFSGVDKSLSADYADAMNQMNGAMLQVAIRDSLTCDGN